MQKKNFSGFTLIELLVTITISAIVMTYAMNVFTGMGKGFKLLGNQNSSVQMMIQKKRQIDKCVNGIGSIECWTTTSLRFKKQDSDSLVNIQFRNDKLVADNRLVCDKISKFKFSVVENSGKVLLWECLSGNSGMIFGASAVRE